MPVTMKTLLRHFLGGINDRERSGNMLKIDDSGNPLNPSSYSCLEIYAKYAEEPISSCIIFV